MKKEIFDDMIKLANKLDKIGLYKEASKVDRIAQNIQYNPWGTYEHFINEYKRHLKDDGKDYASKWMNSLLRWKSQPGGYGNWSKEKRDAFKAQAERLSLDEGAQTFSNFYLPLLLKQFSIDTIIDKNQFERKWQAMSDYAIQNYYAIFGDYVGAVLRKTKRIYDAEFARLKIK
jgi:hypothetical protein